MIPGLPPQKNPTKLTRSARRRMAAKRREAATKATADHEVYVRLCGGKDAFNATKRFRAVQEHLQHMSALIIMYSRSSMSTEGLAKRQGERVKAKILRDGIGTDAEADEAAVAVVDAFRNAIRRFSTMNGPRPSRKDKTGFP